MMDSNSSSSEEQARKFLENIQNQLDMLPETCLRRILPDLQLMSARLIEMADGTVDCHQEPIPETAQSTDSGQELAGILYCWNVQTGEIHFSPAIEHVLGIDLEALPGSRSGWLECIHPDDRNRVQSVIDQAFSGNAREYQVEYHACHHHGYQKNLRDKALLLRNAAGQVVQVNGIVVDISLEKRVETRKLLINYAMAKSNIALRKSQEQFRVALANAPVAVFQTDLELRYTWFYSPFFGLPEEKLLGKRDDEIFSNACVKEFLDLKWKALNNKEVVRQELTLTYADQQRTLIVSVEPFYGPGNRVSGVIGSCLDVTEQRRLEAREIENAFKLEVNRKLLECREKERQSIARHLQDGPIQDLSSMGFSIQLARELSAGSEVSSVLDQLGNGVRSLVSKLREVTNELRPVNVIRFGLTNAIRASAMDFEKRHPNISVKLSLAKAVNQVHEEVSLALYRIFQESLSNIARHSRASVVTVRLLIDLEQVRLEINDNGQGFEMPRSWSDLTRRGSYGLVLMKERAESVGGQWKVQSFKNKGTTIQVSISRAPSIAAVSGGGEKAVLGR